MKARLKKDWIAALVSGDYEQGKFALRKTDTCFMDKDGKITSKDRYCCLGVLCDVAGIKWKESKHYPGQFETHGNTAILHTKLMNQFGLSDQAANKLMNMNDHDFRTFKQIASYIKRYVK